MAYNDPSVYLNVTTIQCLVKYNCLKCKRYGSGMLVEYGVVFLLICFVICYMYSHK